LFTDVPKLILFPLIRLGVLSIPQSISNDEVTFVLSIVNLVAFILFEIYEFEVSGESLSILCLKQMIAISGPPTTTTDGQKPSEEQTIGRRILTLALELVASLNMVQ
jgi:hypothetical protein